ncbi:MBL fold metallo-hydrolase [Halalkalicoccus salilacus]|uniref:MBL fold metallo-hydrolase n=1 Tax=Halalkalicoccus TaxID=332246 RepID=UPI002F96DAC8
MVTEITTDVYDITCLDEPKGKRYRAFLFTGGTPTLFDTGLAETTNALAEGISAIGTEPERVVITHGDGDHIGGFDDVVDRYEVETWVPEQLDVETEHEPDNQYGDGDQIGRFAAVHTPGHAPENHSLIDEDTGIVVLGDALSGADQRGLPPGEFHLPPAVYSEDLNQAEESLEALLEYEFNVGLVYHGSSVTEDARTKIDRYVNFPGK